MLHGEWDGFPADPDFAFVRNFPQVCADMTFMACLTQNTQPQSKMYHNSNLGALE